MDGMKIALALSGIDDKYKAQADIFTQPRRSRGRIVGGVLRGAAGLAGAALLLGVFLFMAQVQRGMEMRGQGNGDRLLLTLPAEPGVAEYVYSGWPEGSIKIRDGWASENLTTDQSLAVFGQSGQTTLALDGRACAPAVWGGCFLDREGNVPYAVICGLRSELDSVPVRNTFTISISRNELPIYAAFDTDDATQENQVFGQKVYTRWFVAPAQEGSDMRRGLQAEFLTDGEEPLGVEIQVYDCEDGDQPGPQSRALLNRLVTLCLRPGNTLSLRALDGLGDHPSLPFPTREDWQHWLAEGDHEVFAHEDAGESEFDEGKVVELTPENFNFGSLWGEDQVTWDGRDMTDFEWRGRAYYRQDGALRYVEIGLGDPGAENPQEGDFITFGLCPGGEALLSGRDCDFPQYVNTLWDVNVTTRLWHNSFYYGKDSYVPEDYFNYEARFVTGGPSPVGVDAVAFTWQGKRTEEEMRNLLAAFVRQCLRPGSTLSLSALESLQTAWEPAVPSWADPMTLGEDGRMRFTDSETQRLYDALVPRSEGGAALIHENQDGTVTEFRQSVSIVLPTVIWQNDLGDRELVMLCGMEYIFMELDGEKTISPVTIADMVGFGTMRESGWIAAEDSKDGWEEFTGPVGGEEWQEITQRRQAAAEQIDEARCRKLLEEYCRLNGLEEYLEAGEEMKTEEDRVRDAAVQLAEHYARLLSAESTADGVPLEDCRCENAHVYQVSADNKAMAVGFTLVRKPMESENLPRLMIGNAKPGTGELEGYAVSTMTQIATLGPGGMWSPLESGPSTGVMDLRYDAGIPEEQVLHVNWPAGDQTG